MRARYWFMEAVAVMVLIFGDILLFGGSVLFTLATGLGRNVDTIAGSGTIAYCGAMALGLGGCMRVLLAIEANTRNAGPTQVQTLS